MNSQSNANISALSRMLIDMLQKSKTVICKKYNVNMNFLSSSGKSKHTVVEIIALALIAKKTN